MQSVHSESDSMLHGVGRSRGSWRHSCAKKGPQQPTSADTFHGNGTSSHPPIAWHKRRGKWIYAIGNDTGIDDTEVDDCACKGTSDVEGRWKRWGRRSTKAPTRQGHAHASMKASAQRDDIVNNHDRPRRPPWRSNRTRSRRRPGCRGIRAALSPTSTACPSQCLYRTHGTMHALTPR